VNGYSDNPTLGILYRYEDLSSPLPLERTWVEGEIIGPIASVKVKQQFSNPYRETVSLEYLFPLPHQAAVYDYQIIIGNRVIRAEILEIVVAREMYHDAIDKGHRASLLEERRPNLYAIQLGNVQPGDAIETIIHYQERLHYSDDGYEFVFPMGITPKYHTDPHEASKVDAPLALGEERVGQVQLTLTIDAGVKVWQPTSPSTLSGRYLWVEAA
jgi:Ca-activated chloride channel homolog